MMKLLFITLLCACSTAIGDMDTEWWKYTTIYELIISSFKDSDGDGIGDIRGLTSKLDHFVDLGIPTIYLTPCFESPMKDMGYEITDYYTIYHKYGTMDDFEELMKEMNARGMKLMFDLVINHSGDTHEWFQKSIDKIDPYTDYYIWVNASGFEEETLQPIPPNEWSGMFGDSAWEWNDKRKQFYYHMFLKEQPDLNLRNEAVKTELKNMIKFWLDKGVAGFRLDAPMFYMESEDLQSDRDGQSSHEENIAFIHEMRLFLDEYNKNHGGFERIYAAEARVQDDSTFYDYFGTFNYSVAHFPFQYMDSGSYVKASKILEILKSRFTPELSSYLPVWVTEGHDGPRIGTRANTEHADILFMITATLPGSLCLYYGQEIAMKDGYITPEQIRDISGDGSRDPARLLMQWDDSMNAGFSAGFNTYLPVSPEYTERNVEKQKNQEVSHYNLVKTLLALRRTETLKYGNLKFELRSPQFLIIRRTYEGHETYILVVNMGFDDDYVNLKLLLWDSPNTFMVAAASVNSEHKKGDEVRNDLIYQIPVRARSSVLLTFHSNVPIAEDRVREVNWRWY